MLVVLRPVHRFEKSPETKHAIWPLFACLFDCFCKAAHSSVPINIFMRLHIFLKSHRRCALECGSYIFIYTHCPDYIACTTFLAARSRLLPLLFPLFDIRFSVLISRCWLIPIGRLSFNISHYSLISSRC